MLSGAIEAGAEEIEIVYTKWIIIKSEDIMCPGTTDGKSKN
jgi:hypothetical protein